MMKMRVNLEQNPIGSPTTAFLSLLIAWTMKEKAMLCAHAKMESSSLFRPTRNARPRPPSAVTPV